MKKLLSILLTAILCLFVVSCTDTPEATPNEIEPPEIVTPNETTEPDTPEVVTPTEQPNEPTEEPEVAEPVTPEADESNENVIVLPAPDENTVELTIGIPQDFIDKPYTVYTAPELTRPEDFEWGQYLPFVCTNTYNVTDKPTQYYILSEECKSFDDGKQLYKELNEKYIIEYTGQRTAKEYKEDITEEYLDFLYKSRIVDATPDLSVIGRIQLVPGEGYWINGDWTGRYDILKEGNVVYSESFDTRSMYFHINQEYSPLSIGHYCIQEYYGAANYDGFVAFNKATAKPTHNYSYFPIFQKITSPETVEEINSAKSTFQINDFVLLHHEQIYIYNEDKTKLTHIINVPSYVDIIYEDGSFENYTMFFHFFNGKIVLEMTKDFRASKNDGNVKVIQSLYVYDLNQHTIEHISDFTYNPHISPDGKYLIYSKPYWPDGVSDIDPFDVMPEGFYVKNTENGTTIFFEDVNPTVISWIDKNKLYELIK